MNKCKRCKVEIVDDTDVCPLCENIVTKDGIIEKIAMKSPIRIIK